MQIPPRPKAMRCSGHSLSQTRERSGAASSAATHPGTGNLPQLIAFTEAALCGRQQAFARERLFHQSLRAQRAGFAWRNVAVARLMKITAGILNPRARAVRSSVMPSITGIRISDTKTGWNVARFEKRQRFGALRRCGSETDDRRPGMNQVDTMSRNAGSSSTTRIAASFSFICLPIPRFTSGVNGNKSRYSRLFR